MENCLICDKKLDKKKRQKMFCSYKCSGISRRGKNNPSYKNPPNKGKEFGEEWKKNLSEAHKKIPSNFEGKHHTEESKRLMSKSRKGKNAGENHPFYGKYHTKEALLKMSMASTGRKFSEEHRKKIGEKSKNRKHTIESKRKLRIKRIKEIESKNGTIFPNYNKKACEYFKKFDVKNNTKGRYAVYGDGEYLIEELGYWPDYINFDMKLIIEWDEEYHKKQQEKDMIRQQEIQEYFPDFEFKRIEAKEVKNG